jgi:hypothetical protein
MADTRGRLLTVDVPSDANGRGHNLSESFEIDENESAAEYWSAKTAATWIREQFMPTQWRRNVFRQMLPLKRCLTHPLNTEKAVFMVESSH